MKDGNLVKSGKTYTYPKKRDNGRDMRLPNSARTTPSPKSIRKSAVFVPISGSTHRSNPKEQN
jgi:hypothetical protein